MKLKEGDVTEYVVRYLEKNDYKIEQVLNVNQKGIDIIASKKGIKIYFEVKGARSSKKKPKRKKFDKSQIYDVVAKGFWTCLKLKMKNPKAIVALAVPLDSDFKKILEPVKKVAKKCKIQIFELSKKKVIITK